MGIPDEPEYASIDVDELEQACGDLRSTLDGLQQHIAGLKSDFNFFGVSTSNLDTLIDAKNSLEDTVPELEQRHSLAVQLLAEQQGRGWAGDGVVSFQGDLTSPFDSIEEAQEAGRELADLVNGGDGEVPPEVYEQLEEYGNDPDFAEAFLNDLTPASQGLLLLDADDRAEGTAGDDPDNAPQLAVAEVFATASFRIDYDAEFISAIREELLDLGLPTADVVERMTPLMQHGTWNYESILAFAEATLSSDNLNDIGLVDKLTGSEIWSALARNPRAAAEFMERHPDQIWDMARFSSYEESEAFAEFIEAATVDAAPIYERLELYDEDQPNIAEQNAAWLIDKVGTQEDPWEFDEDMRMVFANITEKYWDDFMYSFSSPAGVTDNPGRDGIEVDSAIWNEFMMEAMRSEDGAAKMLTLFDEQIGDITDHVIDNFNPDGDVSAYAASWDSYVHGRLAQLFMSNWGQILEERGADADAEREMREGMVDWLVGAGFDPKGTLEDLTSLPKDIAQETIGNLLKGWLNGLSEEQVQNLDTSMFEDPATWMKLANGLHEEGKIPPYDDGTVTWDGDPSFYEEHYGGTFTDSNGNILPLDEIRDDPEALAAYNAWLQDPAVQWATGQPFDLMKN
jgi:hypothetical protein